MREPTGPRFFFVDFFFFAVFFLPAFLFFIAMSRLLVSPDSLLHANHHTGTWA